MDGDKQHDREAPAVHGMSKMVSAWAVGNANAGNVLGGVPCSAATKAGAQAAAGRRGRGAGGEARRQARSRGERRKASEAGKGAEMSRPGLQPQAVGMERVVVEIVDKALELSRPGLRAQGIRGLRDSPVFRGQP